jgi:methylated-DNA-[protein]-cysteine S-methyltransferase
MSEMVYTSVESPIGPLLLAGDDAGLHFLSFASSRRAVRPEKSWKRDDGTFGEVKRQLEEYFRGEREEFDLTLAMEGTGFQLTVWSALRRIPYGETVSYGKLAERIGNPKAVRAVGLANGCNPIPIIVPCHRVIGSDGSLTGFGGGLPTKKKLLDLEARQLRLL